MKKLLLVTNRVMHYRTRIYNQFYDWWKEIGWELHVVSNEYQEVDEASRFVRHELPFGSLRYMRFIADLKPDVVINFLHLKDMMIVPLTLFCRSHSIPMIYWNHGINMQHPDSWIRNSLFHFIHRISSAVIIYSPDQMKYVDRSVLRKTFIAFNTLSFSKDGEYRKIMPCKDDIKSKYGIKEKYVLLYISRVMPYKGLDYLLDYFKNSDNLALVIVGGGINDNQLEIVKQTSHYYYLGEKYGDDVDDIYSIGDLFSTPGHIGLAVNQAFYWGLPVLVLDRIHAPEVYYLKDGVNGYILPTMDALRDKVQQLLNAPDELSEVSAAARRTYENDMQLERMFSGFTQAIDYVTKTKKNKI